MPGPRSRRSLLLALCAAITGALVAAPSAHAGLLFLVPGCDYTLRINGRAWITRDTGLLGRMPAQGVTPRLAIGVDVRQVFFHCVKAFRRARLWAHGEWPGADALPSYACTVFNQIRPDNAALEDYERSIAESDAKLYV